MIGAPAGPSRSGLLGRALALLFPVRCPGCGLRGADLCTACAAGLPWLGADVCPRCAVPSRLGRICGRCLAEPSPLDGVRAACRFDGLVRQVVHELKYRGARARAPLLADLIATTLERRPLAADLLVPVPMWPARERARSFNQAGLIARALGEQLQVDVAPAALARLRDTPRQVGRTGAERLQNLTGAFACPNAGLVRGRRVALVDDVMTTGATLRACAEPLKASGAARVYGIVAARAV